MLSFPSKTVVRRIMPKEAFYKRLTLKSDIKEKFVSDIKRIVLEYKLSSDTLNVEKGKETSEILVISIELKKQELDYRIVENIARQNAHKLIFLLKYEELGQLAIYYHKLFKTKWMPLEEINLIARELNLDLIWDEFIEQIALKEGNISSTNSITVDEKLIKQEYIQKIQKEIEKLERKSRKEKQPKKRFEQFTRLQELKRVLAKEKGE